MLIFKNNIDFCITKDSEATYLGVSQYIFPNQYKKRKIKSTQCHQHNLKAENVKISKEL